MTALFEKAIASVRELPVDAQDALARMLLEYVGGDRSTIELTEAEASSFDESLVQADRGEFASDEQIRAIWARHGL